MPLVPRPFMVAAVPTFLFVLGGCSSTVWYKPGANEMNFSEVKGHCLQRAYAELPVVPSGASLLGAASDANDSAREAAVTHCLEAEGWLTKEVSSLFVANPESDPSDTGTH